MKSRGARRGLSSRSTARRFPESLLESELFGYERGAFTGAAASKPANSSWPIRHVFLDEIGPMFPSRSR